ncbi:hypothetical protein FA13DRAFT_116672 [Coprinellus micaceus]|uniref:Uncharacterized protein n=1 Tax=Coprinellus micaceus TaxID=71717 RepID=A0A4Y7TI77_COPMI|nr:hypothetical protein FA13DRAFT_116672 [Coprinellus micaceus]
MGYGGDDARIDLDLAAQAPARLVAGTGVRGIKGACAGRGPALWGAWERGECL